MKENKKLISEIIEEVKRDMSDEEILSLLAKSKVSKNTNSEESTKYTLGQKAADKIAAYVKCVEELKYGNKEFLKAKKNAPTLWQGSARYVTE